MKTYFFIYGGESKNIQNSMYGNKEFSPRLF